MKSTYVLGAIIVALILAFPLYHTQNSVRAFMSSGSYEAVIVKCESRQSFSLNRGGQRMGPRWSYYPVAQAEQGYWAEGSLGMPKRAQCERMIGTGVTILVNPDKPDEARIMNFMQFWFYPFMLLFMAVFIVFTLIQRSAAAVMTMGVGVATCWAGMAYDFGTIGKPKKVETQGLVNVEGALKACLRDAMREEGVSSPAELKALICKKRGLTALPDLAGLHSLESLDLSLNDIRDLRAMPALPRLRELELGGNKGLASLGGIEGLTALEVLDLRVIPLSDITPLASLKALRDLDFDSAQISDLSPLRDLEQLETLNLAGNPISDISALEGKPELDAIMLYRTQVSDLSPLYGSPRLRVVNLSSKSTTPCSDIKKLKDSLMERAHVNTSGRCD